MNEIEHIGDILRKKESKETTDTMEVIEGKEFILYLLFDGPEEDSNSNRAVSAALKFIKNNYNYYKEKNSYKLKELIFDANKKIIDLNLPRATTEIIAVYEPKNEKERAIFLLLGKLAIYRLSSKEFTRIVVNSKEKLLGEKDLEKKDFNSMNIKNSKDSLFICNNGFMSLLAQKRKDIIKILKYKNILSTRVSLGKIMRNKNTKNLAYLFIKK